METTAADFFTPDEQSNIVNAIKAAEKLTSGEIVVHIENHFEGDLMDHASATFDALDLQKTESRNGVLFYIAVQDHKFAILGDVGINNKVEDCFWTDVAERMTTCFQQGCFADGLVEAIDLAGDRLKSHFPYQDDDVNELPDEISFG